MKTSKQNTSSLSTVDVALLALLRSALFSCKISDGVNSETDWEAVFIEAEHQAVLPLAVEAAVTLAQPLRPPEEIIQKHHGLVIGQVMNNQLLMSSQDELLNALKRDGIPCVVLKGSSVSVNYPRPELRVLGDIDILVSKKSLENAVKALLQLGYRQIESKVEHHLDFIGRTCHVELHFKSTFFLDNQSATTMQGLMAGAFSTLRETRQTGYTFHVLSPDRQAAFLLLHLQQHLKASGVGLRHLCDYVMFLEHQNIEEWMQSVAPTLHAVGLMRFSQVLAKTGVLWLGLSAVKVPWCMEVEDAVCYELLLEFLRSGDLGNKDSSHRASAVLSADKAGQGTVRSMMFTAVRNLNLYTRKHYSITRRLTVLLPFFWVYLPFCYLYKTIKDGGKPEIGQTFSAAYRRKKLFSQLGIFEETDSVKYQQP